ncbi:hypothetical protein CS379_07855 [Methylobacterium frigidaeris]|nr:hypothetical protein CS379_07855 [Methylobacterium frigidaeris]
MPAVRDGEAGTGGEPTIETARTEPPRRITRGELPVVMGRLIDQVEDPALKRALENPANPTEPKGLGTAATRDAVLPKLIKSHYVTLLKGKDPAITVTEVGLAFVAAVRRVFPAYGDPVGRAVFESELAEIGRAATKAEALRRADAFRQRTRERVEALIGAVSGADRLEVDAEAPARGGGRAPTAAMVSFAKSLAARKGIPLPPEATREVGACRVFLNTHAGPKLAPAGEGGTRPPTPAMLRFAASLAREKRIEALPPEVETDFAACRAFLDAHAGGDGKAGDSKAGKAAPAREAPAKKTRRPRTAASPSRAPRRRRAAGGA